MCTLIILRRPDHNWPLLVAANRDEKKNRAWLPPGRHWPDTHPGVIAGKDEQAGGTWLGVNDEGVIAGVLNRAGTLGSIPGKRSRGELVMKALDYASATESARAIVALRRKDYRAFNLLIADRRTAFWLYFRGNDRLDTIHIESLPAGLSMLTDYDCNDPASPRVQAYYPQFETALAPEPDNGLDGWSSWTQLLSSRSYSPEHGPRSAMTIDDGTFGTVSSSLISIRGGLTSSIKRPIWLFASGPPDKTEYRQVSH